MRETNGNHINRGQQNVKSVLESLEFAHRWCEVNAADTSIVFIALVINTFKLCVFLFTEEVHLIIVFHLNTVLEMNTTLTVLIKNNVEQHYRD